jgi:hypothetical protein
VVSWHEPHMSRGLRRWLRVAKVDRAALHIGTPTQKALTWHDLRATGLTWMAVRGDDPLKIRQRAGHSTFSTTELYVREAEAVREGFGDPFPVLPETLLGGSGGIATSFAPMRNLAPDPAKIEAILERDTSLETEPKNSPETGKHAAPSIVGDAPQRETTLAPQTSRPSKSEPRSTVLGDAQPLTLDLLRCKLDAAIVAEAWDAVKAIRERMVEVEREAAGNLVRLEAHRRGRR